MSPCALGEQASATLAHHAMLTPGAFVVVGFSGGADSTALLHWLHTQRQAWQLQLCAVHVNHGLRPSAKAEAEHCAAQCAAWGIACQTVQCQVAELAAMWRCGHEEAGRRARYAAFAAACKEQGASVVALAHTLQDRAETQLFNLARGTALRGLCSIPPKRALNAEAATTGEPPQIIRPLIECTRAQVEAYCAAQGVTYITDESNTNTQFARNRIRHQVLPALAPNWNAMRRMFRALEQDEALLAAGAQELQWHELAAAPPSWRYRALRRELTAQGREPSFANIQELEKNLPKQREQKKIAKKGKEGLPQGLDCATIIGALRVGRRQPKDAMRLCNGAGTKPFKKLCQEHGIPPAERQSLLVLRDDAGLVWIEGMGAAHRCRITEQTQTAWRVVLQGVAPQTNGTLGHTSQKRTQNQNE